MGQINTLTLLEEARSKGWSDQAIVQKAIEMARALWAPTLNRLNAEERVFLSALGRLVEDAPSRRFVETLCEQVLRDAAPRPTEALKQLLAEHGGVPTFFSSMGRLRIKAAAMAPRGMQAAALAEVRRVFHATFGELTLPTHIGKVTRRAESLAKEGISLCLHPLSPEVASGHKAAKQYETYLQTILEKQAGVGIVVQPWRLCPGLSPCSPEASAKALEEALVRLLRPAAKGGRSVMLATQCSDTLPIVVEAYKRALSHADCAGADVALELPGYLKTSLGLLRELVDWASARAAKGARPIKLLLVKGSHLDAERRCAETYGTVENLCSSKTEAETAYALLINAALSSSPKALTPIVGTHELTHLCYAALRWARSGREGMLPICLTLGLGNHLARQFAKLGSPVTLVAGVASEETGEQAFRRYLAATVQELSRPGGFLACGHTADPASVDWNGRARPFITAGSSAGAPSASTPAPAGGGYTPGNLGALLERPYVDTFYEAARAESERKQESIPLTIHGEPCESPLTFIHRSLTVPGLEDYRFTSADYSAVDKALRAATAALATPRGSVEERAEALVRAARALRKRSTELAALLARDAGFTLADAQRELRDAIDACRYYAHEPLRGGLEDGTTPQPLGVVVVAPGTAHPLAEAMHGIAPAWIGGNSIIYKPAAYSTLTGARLTELLAEAGVEVLCLPCMDNEISARLMTDPRVNALLCTATPAQARALAAKAPTCSIFAAAAEGPSIYLSAHSDWRSALRDIVSAAFYRSGQSPAAPHIILVHEQVYNEPGFLPALEDAAGSLSPKPTWIEGAELGPLASPPGGAERALLTECQEGAEWLLLPRAAELGSLLWAPGICTAAEPGSAMARYGQGLPLLGLVRVRSMEEAADLQRQYSHGSRAIIYTAHEDEAENWRQEVGCVWTAVNCCPTPRPGATPTPAWPTAQHAATGPFIGGRHFAAALCNWQETARPTCRSPRRHLVFDPKGIFPTSSNAEETMRLSAAADSISYWWEEEFSKEQPLAPTPGMQATLSYRPLSLCLRVEKAMADTDVAIALMAAMQAGCRVQISAAAARPWVVTFAEQYNVPLTVESRSAFEADFHALAAAGVTVRDPAAQEDTLARAAEAGLPLITQSVLANGRLELLNVLCTMYYVLWINNGGLRPRSVAATGGMCVSTPARV